MPLSATQRSALFTLICLLFSFCGTLDRIKVRTDDGLSLYFNLDGSVNALQVNDYILPKTPQLKEQSGWFVQDVHTGDTEVVRGGTLTSFENTILHTAELSGLLLYVTIEYRSMGGYILADVTVTDISGRERALDIAWYLPVKAVGWRWDVDLNEHTILDETSNLSGYNFPLRVNPDTNLARLKLAGPLSAYPFAVLNHEPAETGLTLAIPPDSPTVFSSGYNQGIFYMKVQVGTSPFYKTPNITRFKIILFRHDPAWGFRDMLSRYYSFFPSAGESRVPRHGLWGTSLNENDPAAGDIAFHEVSDQSHTAKNIEEYRRLGKIDFALQHQMLSFPYTMVGQRQIYGFNRLIRDPGLAWNAMNSWNPDELFRYSNPGPAGNLRSVAEHKEIIRNSVLYDPDQQPVFVARKYWNRNHLTFVTNPDPDLYHDTDQMTVAKFHLAYYHDHLFSSIPELAGIYIDSLYGWGLYCNYRKDHFKYADVPLSYHPVTKDVCLLNKFSQIEYINHVKRDLHPRGKLVFGNGLRPNFIFNAFALDVLGIEARIGALRDPYRQSWYRVSAGRKPFLLLNYHNLEDEAIMDEFWQQCLLYGYALSSGQTLAESTAMEDLLMQGDGGDKNPVPKLRELYAPIQRRISEAGWRPVTHALADNPAIRLERFGPDNAGITYLSIFNTGEKETGCTVTVNVRAIGIDQVEGVRNLIPPYESVQIVGDQNGSSINFHITISSNRVKVFALE